MKPNEANGLVKSIKLPSAVKSYLESYADEDDDDSYILGGILDDTNRAWLSSGSKFVVIDLSTGSKIAAWTFGATLRDYKAKVTCVTELPTSLLEQTSQLLIGLECELIGGMVCLFHCNGSRILRAIQVDCQITSLKYVENIPGSALECFDGIVIIGTHGGGVYVFDLNRENSSKVLMNVKDESDLNIKDELNIANLVVLSLENINIISQQRSIAYKKDHHIAVQINEESMHSLQFVLYNPDNTIKLNTERENILVTNILYVPQLTSLVVGYNVGIFQVWNLLTLELEFTSPTTYGDLPISHIGFLEPCDDPRAFCYLWIVHSTLNRYDEGFPLAIMYSLTYQGKKSINENTFLYQNFLSCNLRFNIELANPDPVTYTGKQFIGGRCLGCRSLTKTSNKDEPDEYILNICQIVWESWTVSAITPVQSSMFLFDIDQWYKEQMPDMCELKTNNYMAVVNLSDTINQNESYLCDVKINSATLMSYSSVQRLEEHFYPNALGFECYCLSNTSITKFLNMGVQRQLLASINEIGPSVLLHPTKIFHQVISSGLIPLYVDSYSMNGISEPMQRQILLSIVLEARLIQFLGKCACDWATGSHTSAGCNLQLLLDWSWNRALVLKQNGVKLTIPLFDHMGEMLDKNSLQYLDSCVRQLGHIANLYNIIIEKCTSFILPEKNTEIIQRQKTIKIVSQYFQVVQWFLNVGLLPEFNINQFDDNTKEQLPYPIKSLVDFYQKRRIKLHCLNGENPAMEDLSKKSCDLLFIDQFIKEECAAHKLKSLWIEDESSINGLYPPPSLHSLLKIYLIPEIKEEHKHSLVLYLLVDYAMTFDNKKYETVIRRLMQFPTMFGLSNTAIKVTQAFWHLDHRDFQLALNQLQCVLAGDCLTQWQHNVVLSALLVQKKTQSALQYLHVRKPSISIDETDINSKSIYDDWDACSNLYLSRGLVYEAFNFNKESSRGLPLSSQENRLRTFFESCKKMGLLSRILLLPLTPHEENIFVKFLKTIDNSYSNDILVLYYLRRTRYIEAHQVNEELKRLTSKGQLPYDIVSDFQMQKGHAYKSEARDQLVGLYCQTLPPITRQLAQFGNINPSVQKVVVPIPMTVNIQSIGQKTASYKSSFIQETMEKASETWMRNSIASRNLKRAAEIEDMPFLCTPKIMKYASKIESYEKMSTTPDGTPKHLNLQHKTNENDEQMNPLSNITPKMKKEIDLLLHTPLIKRKSVDKLQNDSHYRYSEKRNQRDSTPQSILKVKRTRDQFLSTPIDEKFLIETDDEMETGSQYTQSDNLSRSIRFNIPSRNGSSPPSSEYTSDVHDSFYEICGHHIEKPFKNSISPRKSIHQSCDSCKTSPHTTLKSKTSSDNLSNEILDKSSKVIHPDECESINITSISNGPEKSQLDNTVISKNDYSEIVNNSILASDLSEAEISDTSLLICSSSNTMTRNLKTKIEDDKNLIENKSTSDIEESNDCKINYYSDFMKKLANEKLTLVNKSQNIEVDSIDPVHQSELEISEENFSELVFNSSEERPNIVEAENVEQNLQDCINKDETLKITGSSLEDIENQSCAKIISETDINSQLVETSTLVAPQKDIEYDELKKIDHSSIIIKDEIQEDVLTKFVYVEKMKSEINHDISTKNEISISADETEINHDISTKNEIPVPANETEINHDISTKNEISVSADENKPNESQQNIPPIVEHKNNVSSDVIDDDADEIKTKDINECQEFAIKSESLKTPKVSKKAASKNKEKAGSDNGSKISSSRRSIKGSSKIDTLSQSSVDSDQESITSSRRKSRRSMLSIAKPNLSVIPELSQIENDKSCFDTINTQSIKSTADVSDIIEHYSSTRRLTRHQKSLIEKSINNSQNISVTMDTSKISLAADGSDESNDNMSQCSNMTDKTLDPILLLDKRDFEGPPDLEEQMSSRASSVVLDTSEIEIDINKRKRAYSEPRNVELSKRLEKIITEKTRKLNTPVKMLGSLNCPSPTSEGSRSRRLSFNKAIEAICTPKRKRRLSTDSRRSDSEENMQVPEKMDQNLINDQAAMEKLEVISEKQDDENDKPVNVERSATTSDEVKLNEVTKETPTRRSNRKRAVSVHGDQIPTNINDVPSKDCLATSSVTKNVTTKRTRGKAASVDGETTKQKNRRGLSILSSPLPEEELMDTDTVHIPPYRKKIGTHKVIQPLRFVLRKK